MIADIFKEIGKKDDKNDSARVAARKALKLFEEKAIKGLKEDKMSELKELISYLQKVDEKYPENIVNYVNIDLETFDNENISIDLDIRTSSVNLYSTTVTKKFEEL